VKGWFVDSTTASCSSSIGRADVAVWLMVMVSLVGYGRVGRVRSSEVVTTLAYSAAK
jgi:hypothetical protein